MANFRMFIVCMLVSAVARVTNAEEGLEPEDVKTSIEDNVGEGMFGLGNLFKGKSFTEDKPELGLKKAFDDTIGESMKGMGSFLKGAGDRMKDAAENGMETLKNIPDVARDASEAGAEKMKDWSESLGDRLGKARERITEHGTKLKDAIGSAAFDVKDEVQEAASRLAEQAKSASEGMMKIFG